VSLYDYDRESVTVHSLEGLMARLEKQFELLPAENPAAGQQAVATTLPAAQPPEEKRKSFPECN
jgi:hypothetical protein